MPYPLASNRCVEGRGRLNESRSTSGRCYCLPSKTDLENPQPQFKDSSAYRQNRPHRRVGTAFRRSRRVRARLCNIRAGSSPFFLDGAAGKAL